MTEATYEYDKQDAILDDALLLAVKACTCAHGEFAPLLSMLVAKHTDSFRGSVPVEEDHRLHAVFDMLLAVLLKFQEITERKRSMLLHVSQDDLMDRLVRLRDSSNDPIAIAVAHDIEWALVNKRETT